MEYAAGGELFERICNAGRFSEDEVGRTHFVARVDMNLIQFCASYKVDSWTSIDLAELCDYAG